MQEENKLLSVIVPVYNTDTYLTKCIESIVNQTYRTLEIILIDDGSTDKSGAICDQYADVDKRIKVVHKDNQGLVPARKQGLQMAQGEVVTFVDSDDWIEPDMYEEMMEIYERENVDLVSTGFIIDDWDGRSIGSEHDLPKEGVYCAETIKNDIVPIMMWNEEYSRWTITSAVWNKLFRRELLKEVIQPLDNELTLGEDAAITYPFITMAEKIYIKNKSWYHYVMREKSMSRAFDFSVFEKIYRFKDYLTIFLERKNLLEELSMTLESYVRIFLNGAVKNIYAMDMERIFYLFPFEHIKKGSKIILYGAGSVGKSYWNCLQHSKYADVVAWVDGNYEKVRNKFVQSPEIIEHVEADYIVICIENEKTANDIRNLLLEKDIKKEKIIWSNQIKK